MGDGLPALPWVPGITSKPGRESTMVAAQLRQHADVALGLRPCRP